MSLASWSVASIPRLDGRVALVTGANQGIGNATARALLGAGAYVIVAGRDRGRVNAAVSELSELHPGRVEAGVVDISVFSSVAAFAGQILAKHPVLHMLICNAGIACVPVRRVEGGFEQTMTVNHLGHALLTRMLLPSLRRAAPSRVVFIATKDDLLIPPKTGGLFSTSINVSDMETYGAAKFMVFSYARALSGELGKQGIDVAVVHPGALGTNVGMQMTGLFGCLVNCITRIIGNTMANAIGGITYAATSAEFQGKGFGAFNPPHSGYKGRSEPWCYTPGSILASGKLDNQVYTETNAILINAVGSQACGL